MKNTIKKALIFIPLSLLVACGGESESGGGGVGNQSDEAPIAVASVFGANINTDEMVDVRSDSEVLLSGQSSDGIDDPILHFAWKQTDSSGYSVQFYERTSNSVAFTAPKIPITQSEGVELSFELTVEDADGAVSSDEVHIRVKPARDANHFLLAPRVDEQYAIFVVASEGAAIVEDIAVTVSVDYRVSWLDRSGELHSLNLETNLLHGTVSAEVSARATESITDSAELYFLSDIPLLDADDVNVNFQGEFRAGRLEPENLAAAVLEIELTLAQQGTGNIELVLARKQDGGFEALDLDGLASSPTNVRFSDEWVRQQLEVESKHSANNYYDCIDPLGEARTLNDWFEYADFVEGADDIYHTAYVNNFDLNFGRDMWLRSDSLGNVFTYVKNYPSLENTLSGRNDFAVVVMEFSAAPTGMCGDGTFTENDGGKKIVKFYAYVPDETTGEYVRAATMNFDGRGERAMPGVCVACHFGDTNTEEFNRPNLSDIEASEADLNSSYIAWDLDSFLYTIDSESGQIDPIYAANSISDYVTETFSRDSQENDFRAQNQAVLDTYTYDANTLLRYAPAIQMLHGVYGNGAAIESLDFGSVEEPLTEEALLALKEQVNTLPTTSFSGNDYTPVGWRGQEELYERVVARNCRICHAQQENPKLNFDTYEEFVTNEKLVSYVYERGLMPLSRLTMDRFWADFYGGVSAAEFLREHLNSDGNPDNDVPLDLVPGSPVAVVQPQANPELDFDIELAFGESVLFDASESYFSDRYQWRVDGVFRSSDNKFNFTAGSPGDVHELGLISFKDGQFITSEEETRRIRIINNRPSGLGVADQSLVEGQQLELDLYQALCADNPVDSIECRSVFGDILNGSTPNISIVGEGVNGSVEALDSALGLVTFRSTAAESDGAASFEFTLSDSFGEASEPARVVFNINSLTGPEIVADDNCLVAAINFTNSTDFPFTFDGSVCASPELNDTTSVGLTLSLVGVDGSAMTSGSIATLNDGQINYSPGRFFTGQESFLYTVQDSSPSAKSSTGSVSVIVEPSIVFADLNSGDGLFNRSGDEGCADCHGIEPDAPDWRVYENILNVITSRTESPYSDPRLVITPSASGDNASTETLLEAVIFQKACGLLDHTGGNRLCIEAGMPEAVSDLNPLGQRVLRWIEEGAPR